MHVLIHSLNYCGTDWPSKSQGLAFGPEFHTSIHLDHVLPIEWLLLPRVFDTICNESVCPHIDLFATKANINLPLFVSHCRSHGMEGRCLPSQFGWSQHLCLPSIHFSKTGPHESLGHSKPHHDSQCFSLASERVFADLLFLLVKVGLELSMEWNLLVQLHIRQFHRSLESLKLYAWRLSSISSVRWDLLRRLQS